MRRLPLDSPDWIPIADVHRALCGVTGSPGLAVKELHEKMRSGDVPSMRRCFAYRIRQKIELGRVVDQARGIREAKVVDQERALIGPERELLPREHWDEHRPSLRADGSVEIIEGFRSIVSVKGYAYFVWKPALAKVWPTVAAFAPTSPREKDEPPIYGLIRAICGELWPGGYAHIGTAQIIKDVGDVFKDKKEPVPRRDVFLRALDRRKG